MLLSVYHLSVVLSVFVLTSLSMSVSRPRCLSLLISVCLSVFFLFASVMSLYVCLHLPSCCLSVFTASVCLLSLLPLFSYGSVVHCVSVSVHICICIFLSASCLRLSGMCLDELLSSACLSLSSLRASCLRFHVFVCTSVYLFPL